MQLTQAEKKALASLLRRQAYDMVASIHRMDFSSLDHNIAKRLRECADKLERAHGIENGY